MTIHPRAMIAGALAWLDRGFAVFPINPRSKVPLTSLVPHGFLDASRDHAVVCDWWGRAPKANIGIATGAGHFVLDLDDADAVSWFANACGRHGAPKTLTVRTARGFHVFFSCAVEVPCSTGRLAPGVDIRGEGGCAVAAPSVHPSGAVYTIARDLPIAEAPQWIIDEAMPPPPQPLPALVPFRSDATELRGLPGILSLMANAREGERNRLLFWGACRLAEKVRAGLIEEGEARYLLQEAGRRSGLTGREILATARSALSGRRA
jgi:Bifunctional DNA primase/polymerase, N-terminal